MMRLQSIYLGLVVMGCMMLSLVNDSVAAEKRIVMTSVKQNISMKPFQIKGKAGDIKWSVTKKDLYGGRQQGVEMVIIDNGVMAIEVIPTRGMGIFRVTHHHSDLALGWESPLDEIVHPAFVDHESRGGLGWLEGFNEWMVRCGLEYAGHPGKDEFINNTGDKASMDLTLHGKIQNIPASEVELIIKEKPPYRITLVGTVYEKFFYGPKLKMEAAVSVVPGESTFRIHDEITNMGDSDQEFQIIYHANFGSPLLEQGAKMLSAAKKVAPMNGHAAKSIDQYASYQGPTKGFIEEVYLIEPLADEKGKCLAVLTNKNADKAASMRWHRKELPYLTQWKNTASQDFGYVTGIEPATGYPYNRMIERAGGRVPKLGAGKTRAFTLDIGLHVNAKEVEQLSAEVARLQHVPVTIERKPLHP